MELEKLLVNASKIWPASKLSVALWRRGGKRKESLQLRLWNLNILIQKVDVKGWLAEMTLVMTSLPLARVFQWLFTFALVSAWSWLAEIWQLSRRGATGELEVEFKLHRCSCKLSFLFPPRRQSASESLLACWTKLQLRVTQMSPEHYIKRYKQQNWRVCENLLDWQVFKNQNFSRFPSSLSICASFCIRCVIYTFFWCFELLFLCFNHLVTVPTSEILD